MLTDGLTFGTYYTPCDRGHETHETIVIPIDLLGKHSHDFANFPDHVRCQFDFQLYDESKYRAVPGVPALWCQGKCSLCNGIATQGVWESFETRLALEIFTTNEPGLVLDYGANHGWYSVIAALKGHDVIAFEMDPETSANCRRNMELNGVGDKVTVHRAFIDMDTPPLPADEDVLLLKSDVEGSEFAVVKMCQALFDARRVQYALLEISPCFKPGYDVLLRDLMDLGYGAFVVPSKGAPNREAFGLDPLNELEPTRITDPMRWIKGKKQENVIMVRE